MNMVYRDEILYVDIYDNEEIENIEYLKHKIFSILREYEVGNVVINLVGSYNKCNINSLINDYHKNYNGSLLVDIK